MLPLFWRVAAMKFVAVFVFNGFGVVDLAFAACDERSRSEEYGQMSGIASNGSRQMKLA